MGQDEHTLILYAYEMRNVSSVTTKTHPQSKRKRKLEGKKVKAS